MFFFLWVVVLLIDFHYMPVGDKIDIFIADISKTEQLTVEQ